MISRCAICNKPIQCYDSTREPKLKYCDECFDICPKPTGGDSHGWCEKHLNEKLKEVK